MELPPSTRDRIFDAANELYEEAARRTFPTVDAVRKLAKVNMNDASTGMREWRRAQSTHIAPMTVQVPSTLQQSSSNALAALWSEALALANETLRSAQSGWDVERAEAEALREQMANAYEALAAELEAAQTGATQLQMEIERANAALTEAQKQSDDALREIAAANAAVKQAEARTIEIERRANDLSKELDYAHSTIAIAATDLTAARHAYSDEIAGLRTDLAQTRSKAEHQETTMHANLALAREELAVLRGKLDALRGVELPPASRQRSRKKTDGEAKK